MIRYPTDADEEAVSLSLNEDPSFLLLVQLLEPQLFDFELRQGTLRKIILV
ncbi:hypothetical protein NDU88_009282, partial [Pleurodeles waltl]